ncbi:tyrosine-type recombinase/integrase [Maribacter flavus]|uniref:Tyrosine-type recombinase/integrase n=1 Tax=Maribacter flavus TaxID=1658664 RepID=A0A5B2TWB6_9FLAO|nr:phage integrase SAM-like domain-containing protein [Maribacter flavus]KAA2218549.1 tyrosine-type recombinase/integrase [Maribacter flavus]
MATIYFLYRSSKQSAPLTIRLQDKDDNGEKFQLEAKTEIEVSKEFWKVTRHKKRNLSGHDKNEISEVHGKLAGIENYVLSFYKKEKPSREDKDWLKTKVFEYDNPNTEDEVRSDKLTDCIQYLIDTANIRENGKKGLGLSKSRINSYKNLLKIIRTYQGNKSPYRVKDVNVSFGKAFLDWMINKSNYSESYARKKIDDLKTVCRDALTDGLEVNTQLSKVKGGKPGNNQILYLDNQEINAIKFLKLLPPYLENARKWLLFGCNIGQRGGDLLNISKDNFIERDGLKVIEIQQQKTGKQVTIPILEETEAILKDGLPEPIAIQNLNKYIKELCRRAGIDERVKGSKITMLDKDGVEIPRNDKGEYIAKGVKRKISGTFPKYELMSSHVCRRSFATNLYGILPTPLIMQITQHSTEKMLLQYIGKNSLDYARQIKDFYDLQKLRKERSGNLEVVKENIAN